MAKATLSFEVEDRGGIRVIHMTGPLDSATYNQCKDYLEPLIQ